MKTPLLLLDATTNATNYEQMASIYSIVSLVLFILAGVLLVFAIFAFIKFKIPTIIGDLTGRNARKGIKQIRESNEKSGAKSHRPHPVAYSRGTVTEEIPENDKKANKKSKKTQPMPKQPVPQLDANATEVLNYSGQTEVLDGAGPTEVLDGAGAGPTEVLDGAGPTDTLEQNGTTQLNYDDGAGTMMLNEGTQVLSNDEMEKTVGVFAVGYKMLQNIVYIHTNEEI